MSEIISSKVGKYVYWNWIDDMSEWVSSPHRVIKKTAKRVYVAFDHERTIVLDRYELETNGHTFSRRHKIGFDVLPHEEKVKAKAKARTVDFLGEQINATEEAVKATYYKLAMKCHPDHGGTVEDFKELSAAYEQALARARWTK